MKASKVLAQAAQAERLRQPRRITLVLEDAENGRTNARVRVSADVDADCVRGMFEALGEGVARLSASTVRFVNGLKEQEVNNG